MPFEPIETVDAFERRIVTRSQDPERATLEGLFLDLKREVGHQLPGKERDQAAREYARDVVQFANSEGGCLVIGVAEQPTEDGRTVAGAIVGVQEPARAVAWMEEAFSNYVYPAIVRPHIVQLVVGDGRTVLVVNVEPEASLVAVWNRHRGHEREGMEFLYRNNHGKHWMTPDEVAMRMNDRHRAIRLSLGKLLQRAPDSGEQDGVLITLLHHPVRPSQYNAVQYWPHAAVVVGDLGQDEFVLRLSQVSEAKRTIQGEVTIPYDWIVTFWWDRKKSDDKDFIDRPAIQLTAGFWFNANQELNVDYAPPGLHP